MNLLFDYGKIGEPLKRTTTIPNEFQKRISSAQRFKIEKPRLRRGFSESGSRNYLEGGARSQN